MSVIEVSDLARLLLAVASDNGSIGATYEADDGVEGGWSHKDFGRAIGRAVGRRVMTLATPRPLLAIAARFDRLVRGAGAKLTPDRVDYFCHPDWMIDPATRPPPSLWKPIVETSSGLVATADWYRRKGWLKP